MAKKTSKVTAFDDYNNIFENTSIIIPVTDNDTAPGGSPLTIVRINNIFTLVSDTVRVANGFVTDNNDGTLTYTPDQGFTGTERFTYSITDNTGGDRILLSTATVTIDVRPAANGAPVLAPDTAVTTKNTSVVIDVLANDTDPDGDLLSVRVVSTPLNGAATVNPGGTITYTPSAGFVGTDTFVYQADDGKGGVEEETVTVTVTAGPNLAPVAADDTAATQNGTPVVIAVLANDTDADGDTLSVSAAGPASSGIVAVNPNGTVTYTPDAGFSGTDTFTYTVSDGAGGFDSAVVSVNVAGGINAAPNAADDMAATSADTHVIIDVLANDSDPDSDPLSVISAGGSAHGAVSVNTDGTLTYAPDAGFSGMDTFTYTISDGNGGQDTAQVTVHVSAGVNHNPHDPSDPLHGEHDALFNLVKHADATHVAVNSGSWFDPNTWSNGLVPGDGAKVVISHHVQVDYDGVSNARLFTVRVDGELNFATDTDSQMIVDTLVVDPAGKLTAGTAANPVAGNVNVDIIIANNGAIDTAWDPTLISRGVISHGTVEIHGQEKTTHLKVAEDPMAGDTSMLLSEAPVNWNVGDTIVLTGTEYDGYVWEYNTASFRPPQDEVLTITAINGQTVHFDKALQYDHGTPRADLKASVANYTRNVSVETEDAATAATHERGHVMFMHSDQVDVRFAEFHELGRTDKSINARNASEFSSIASDSNVKGRYAFHLHKTGVDDAANPTIAEGNAVFGSPGWGFVHHASNAILHDNATYNTFGAGFVAETGNEIGTWSSNIAIYAKGRNWGIAKNQNDAGNFDTGRGGDGFFFQGRMVESMDNIAASVNHGFTYYHRGRFEDPANGLDGQIHFDPSLFDLPDTLDPGLIDPNKPPILNFIGNEVFAANEGLHIVKHNPYQGFDVHSRMEDFTAWEVNVGAYFDYTGHYSLEDFDLTGKIDPARDSAVRAGIIFSQNAVDMVAVNPSIANFRNGIDLHKGFSFNEDIAVTQYKIVNPTFSNIANQELLHYDPNIDEVLDTSELVLGRFIIDLDGPLYFDPTDPSVKIFGSKTDSIGTIDIPAGTDGYDTGSRPNGYNAKTGEILSILENDGYYSAGGKNYFVLEDYYSERATGEIFKFGYLVEMAPSMAKLLGNDLTMYANAVYRGQIDLNNRAPVTGNETVSAQMETDIVIDLLQNDSDPDGDAVWIDGIVQPDYGRVFDNGDGTVTYRPYLDFQGTESFKYWVTDGFGAFTEAWVTVDVAGV